MKGVKKMSKRWKPEKDGDYFFINFDGRTVATANNEYAADSRLIEFGNCFGTRKAAEAAAEKVKELLLSLHEEQPVTDCNQLPKLTVEVFDREDCPEWAKYAAVDDNGTGTYYEREPEYDGYLGCWLRSDKRAFIIGDGWDYTDWQHSLIERPAKENKLPDWCKVGEWCYCLDDDGNPKYFKITTIKDNYIYGEDWDIDYHFVSRAHLRSYNAKEMKALVGRTVDSDTGARYLVTKFYDTLEGGEVCIDGIYYSADALLAKFTIDGNPCGKLEHLNENGEWVE